MEQIKIGTCVPGQEVLNWLPHLVKHGFETIYAYHRTPGFGDSNWRDILSILHMDGYKGDICIEGFHGPVYSGDWEMTAQLHALQYLKWCHSGNFIANPWDKTF